MTKYGPRRRSAHVARRGCLRAHERRSREKTTLIESIYADYANEMKAREARRRRGRRTTSSTTPTPGRSTPTNGASLRAKLDASVAASPLERQAQRLANSRWRPKAYSNGWPPEKRKKEASRD
ncbi:MAG: hypothetical protein ACLVJ6_04880 [Merdibacter sp.]